MLSYWEREHFLKYDLIVAGAGIVGLSVAVQYAIKYPEKKVLVLERGLFPSGASTKNAGFACFGSLTEILDDLNYLSEIEVSDLVKKRFKGLNSIREFFGDESLGYQATGGYELITENEIDALSEIDRINQLLSPIFQRNVFEVFNDIKAYGFGPKVRSIVKNHFEGELDSGMFLDSLWKKSQSLGIKILTGANVKALDLFERTISVESPLPENTPVTFQAEQIAICTNAFTKIIVPDLDIKPGRGLILVSKPLEKELPWSGSFHYDKGYVYFRKVYGNRLLIGGGRNIDFEGEQTDQFEINPKIKSYLFDLIEKEILPNQKFSLEMEWTGIMAFGKTKQPIIKMIAEDVCVGVRLGGMGVAIGWETATEMVSHF
ncbi:glycine/D-amino acid oxidase, deaminating [Belliella baltica DSM 15883]|uniref:Glycine/D-amino acid oxidase, deaminating n=1 Tax=Belliella baltica (strain DSM 15883 / CIP 108006 / LMG 21964 / BA134) TaxID=866536 RepID=I3Z0N6_BELBD|nr:FAD-dependent oxidoreductase [Belliella baltica]AFL82804.1 glycine/D-amino acid oxidase, deaminating [Belliella baltica DSM 15883]